MTYLKQLKHKTFNGDLLIADSQHQKVLFDLDKNGRQTSQLDDHPDWFPFEYDWDGNLRYGQYMNPTLGMEAKYDPDGVRIYKHRIWNLDSYWHKYIVDTVGETPRILLILDANENNAVVKTYVHANNQILTQHDDDVNSLRYFYLHDRLGSVRLVIDHYGAIHNHYTYEPFGRTIESYCGTLENPFRFTGQYFDFEIEEYYLRERQYNPYLERFTSRDPVAGEFQEPLTLHMYLYCINDPANRMDPSGEFSITECATTMLHGAVIGAITGGVAGGLSGGAIGHGGEWSWSGAARGAARGVVFGGIQGAFFSTGGYLFEVLKKSPVLMGAISGATTGTIKAIYDQWRAGKWDMEAVFRQAAVDAVGGGVGGAWGYVGGLTGASGTVGFRQATEDIYNYFFVVFGGWPPLGPPE